MYVCVFMCGGREDHAAHARYVRGTVPGKTRELVCEVGRRIWLGFKGGEDDLFSPLHHHYLLLACTPWEYDKGSSTQGRGICGQQHMAYAMIIDMTGLLLAQKEMHNPGDA